MDPLAKVHAVRRAQRYGQANMHGGYGGEVSSRAQRDPHLRPGRLNKADASGVRGGAALERLALAARLERKELATGVAVKCDVDERGERGVAIHTERGRLHDHASDPAARGPAAGGASAPLVGARNEHRVAQPGHHFNRRRHA
eukprot:285926-Chlamydomonas_euryale.AAC.3